MRAILNFIGYEGVNGSDLMSTNLGICCIFLRKYDADRNFSKSIVNPAFEAGSD